MALGDINVSAHRQDGAHSYLMDQLKVDVSKQYMREGKEQRTGIRVSEK
jgi:hypothetical protein